MTHEIEQLKIWYEDGKQARATYPDAGFLYAWRLLGREYPERGTPDHMHLNCFRLGYDLSSD